uniref:Cadherin-86C n=1 Tax=Magallana gigas TaxID=29159 RepID=K1P4W8_MAGGI
MAGTTDVPLDICGILDIGVRDTEVGVGGIGGFNTSLASKLPPSITADKQFVQVEEGPSGLNETLFTITAKELNGGNVEVIPTGLTNDIVKTNGTNNTATVTVKVFLKKALDRESQLSVSLFVMDINDEPPKFSQIAYRKELLENHNLSNDIGANVFATDPDNGLGGLVTYTLQRAQLAGAQRRREASSTGKACVNRKVGLFAHSFNGFFWRDTCCNELRIFEFYDPAYI